MPGSIKAIRIIELIIGILILAGCAIAGLVFMFAGGFAGASGQEAGAAAGGIGMGLFFIILGLVHFLLGFFAAKGLAKKTAAGKILTIIVSILWLVPWGIIMLILLMNDQSKAWLESTS